MVNKMQRLPGRAHYRRAETDGCRLHCRLRAIQTGSSVRSLSPDCCTDRLLTHSARLLEIIEDMVDCFRWVHKDLGTALGITAGTVRLLLSGWSAGATAACYMVSSNAAFHLVDVSRA